ncbi:MAG TPA: helix-turn-helix transcriptional regulator [Gemmataceae bacterium]|jgi:transcriptional regulator with XRE-family HTH domain|nr:helix-turn-helix transcriptional regulator [Gemmataceae bacterium]
MAKTLGDKLRNLRLRAGLSCEQLAKRSGVTAVALHAYEKGASVPTLGSVQRLAKALGIPFAAFGDVRLPPDARTRKLRKQEVTA